MSTLTRPDWIKAIIRQKGYSQAQVAKALNISREWLNERINEDNLTPEMLKGISDVVGFDFTKGQDQPTNVSTSDCCEAVKRLEGELQAANRTIADLSAALRAALDRK